MLPLINDARKMVYPHAKETGPLSYTANNSKWIKDNNIEPGIIKLLCFLIKHVR